jgi:hypothetical protein
MSLPRSESMELTYSYRLIGKPNFFFSTSGVQFPETDRVHLHFHHTTFSPHLKSWVGNILVKADVLRITLNLDGTPIVSQTHSPITLTNFSSINLISIFRSLTLLIHNKQQKWIMFSDNVWWKIICLFDKTPRWNFFPFSSVTEGWLNHIIYLLKWLCKEDERSYRTVYSLVSFSHDKDGP